MSDPITSGMIHEAQRMHAAKWGEIEAGLAAAIQRKVAEEAAEVAMLRPSDPWSLWHHEIGDVLFAAIAACRIADVDPSAALSDAIKRNRNRWRVD